MTGVLPLILAAIAFRLRMPPGRYWFGSKRLQYTLHSSGLTISQAQIRCISAPATAPSRESETSTESNDHISTKPDLGEAAQPKKNLRTFIDANPSVEATRLVRDVRKLVYQLKRIYDRQRSIHRQIKGPYRVRSEPADAKVERRIEVNKRQIVFVAGKPIPNIWLRDNCQCSQCTHSATKQRLLDTFAIPEDIAIKKHTLQDTTLQVEWSDGHESSYTRDMLDRAVTPPEHLAVARSGLTELALWGSSVASDPPVVQYDLERDSTVKDILHKIRTFGFCYVDQTPFDTPNASEEMLKRISFIRETHYGGFYDFTADLASKDTAYTNIALEAHTDTTYFSDPAGLQAFHLLSHTDGEGGASLLVDGFHAAEQLLKTDKQAYKTLSQVGVWAHASGNQGISIQPYRAFPVLEHDPSTGDLLRVRWNSSDRANIDLHVNEVEAWYDAARKFDALLKKSENEFWEQLKPGRLLIFDNWRVLHGRSKFTGKRRICGGYINRDDWISRYKMLTYGKAVV